jgi:hypothetical protein
MTTRPFACCALLLVAATFGTTSARADEFDHIDDLAVRLQGQARALYGELREHYSHAAHGDHLISDAAAMYRTAAHIHEIAHHAGNVFHLRNDLASLDRNFHHLEGLLDDSERHARFDPWHGGHAHGPTGHVKRLMAEMEDTLHHLRSDVNRLAQPAPVYGGGYGGYGTGGYGTGGYVYGPGGFYWRTGSIRP